jgi:hypothetical protein
MRTGRTCPSLLRRVTGSSDQFFTVANWNTVLSFIPKQIVLLQKLKIFRLKECIHDNGKKTILLPGL